MPFKVDNPSQAEFNQQRRELVLAIEREKQARLAAESRLAAAEKRLAELSKQVDAQSNTNGSQRDSGNGTQNFSGTVALAPLTGVGTAGSITFVNGQATQYTAPT